MLSVQATRASHLRQMKTERAAPSNNKMQRTKHCPNGASPLILVLSRPQAIELRRETAAVTDFTHQAGALPSRRARVDCPRE